MGKKFGAYFQNVGVSQELMQRVIDYRLGAPKSTSHRLITEELVREFSDDSGVIIQCLTALTAGKHLILEGVKGTGKNTLINLLAFLFGRPVYTHSFNKFSDVDSIVGSNTLKDGTVEFKPHQLTEALEDPDGGWFIADEINMARGDTLAFLHELLDDRGEIEIPGYKKIAKNRHFRFIGTMNYGYQGTQELNEAFADRFEVIHIEPLSVESLSTLLTESYSDLKEETSVKLARMYHDTHRLATDGEISSRGVTIRGIKSMCDLILNYNLSWKLALEMSVLNKTFDSYERSKILDVANTLLTADTIFSEKQYLSEVANRATEGTNQVNISGVDSL